MNKGGCELDRVFRELCDLIWSEKYVEAKPISDQLAEMLGNPTPESLRWHVHSWCLIYEARGDPAEAIRLADVDIARKRAEIEEGDFVHYPRLLGEAVLYLQDSLYIQALRYRRMGAVDMAMKCLVEACEFAERYNVPLDEDVKSMLSVLNP